MLIPILREKVLPDSIVETDSWQVYDVWDVAEFHHTAGELQHGVRQQTRPSHQRCEHVWNQAICGASLASLQAVFLGS